MKYAQLYFTIFLFLFASQSQAQIVLNGKIEYQRKMNIHRQFDDMGGENNSYMDAWLAKLPKYDTRSFTCYFSRNKTRYSPVKQEENPMLGMMGGLPGTQTEIWKSIAEQKIIASKKVYEQTFLIDDSLPQYEWKIMDEVRTIAGYTCRKAITKMNDSVVVVAFYTDKIPVSSGPESFAGLPGMILEIAIPRLFTTWIAQSVTLQTVGEAELTQPEKGKKITLVEMQHTIKSSTKNWGKFADKSIWWSSL